ncbi:unnamed protein product [Adineta ricciae]|uniref:Uncharacterized protein n=1 Tax=Adineta ricciae TaxID=249248 RepID=A0A814W891_ADIRI|nr:unnamed protein product [Adineta ricciae]CAF1198944.1 unnamed protein product [Adineta ricciae]
MSSAEGDVKAAISDAKIATEAAPPGMNSITNTVGMHPSSGEGLTPPLPNIARRGSCDKPGCTAEHSGKPHE